MPHGRRFAAGHDEYDGGPGPSLMCSKHGGCRSDTFTTSYDDVPAAGQVVASTGAEARSAAARVATAAVDIAGGGGDGGGEASVL